MIESVRSVRVRYAPCDDVMQRPSTGSSTAPSQSFEGACLCPTVTGTQQHRSFRESGELTARVVSQVLHAVEQVEGMTVDMSCS